MADKENKSRGEINDGQTWQEKQKEKDCKVEKGKNQNHEEKIKEMSFIQHQTFGKKIIYKDKVYEIVQMVNSNWAMAVLEDSDLPAQVYLVPIEYKQPGNVV